MLRVFNHCPVAHKTSPGRRAARRAGGYRRDTITLGWEERLKARGRRRADGGFEFGTTLAARHDPARRRLFVLDEAAIVVVVAEARSRCSSSSRTRRRSGGSSHTASATAISR